LAQTVVMTVNETLSIPNTLKDERPDDYYDKSGTIEWPLGPHGEPFPIVGNVVSAVVFKDGGHVATAKELVRFLVGEGWLGHYLDFSGERVLPPMPKLLDAPFWLDPSDPHRMASVMQVSSRPLAHDFAQALGDWRLDVVWQEFLWAKAVHRVAADDISSEQAVDDAIARIKQILAE
jgi:multiple sugar transport system substrate-binding protein